MVISAGVWYAVPREARLLSREPSTIGVVVGLLIGVVAGHNYSV